MSEPLTPVNLPSSREEAAALGVRRYFSGEPCPHGHVAHRYTQNGYCVECQRVANRADRARIKAKFGEANHA